MSEYGYCKRGGMEGICTTAHQIIQLTTIIQTRGKVNKNYEFVPLVGVTRKEQTERIENADFTNSFDNAEYFETKTGQHGWCNKVTGHIVQWG